MAAKSKGPVTLKVISNGKTYEYTLTDRSDWGAKWDNTLLEISTRDGKTHYWPVDSVTQWIEEPIAAITPGHS